jgi:hypothetical protein
MSGVLEFITKLFYTQIYEDIDKRMYSKSLAIAITIAKLTENEEELTELWEIYEKTTDQADIPLSMLETFYERHRNESQTREHNLLGHEVTTWKAIQWLSKAYINIIVTVTKIAKEENLEIDFDISEYAKLSK